MSCHMHGRGVCGQPEDAGTLAALAAEADATPVHSHGCSETPH